MIFIYIIILLVSLIYLYLTRNFNHWAKRGVNFVKPTPFFGNLKDVCLWKTTIGEYLKSVYEKSKSMKETYIGLFFLDNPILMVNDLEMIQNILIRDFDVFRDRTITNNEKYDGIGSNILFLLKSKKWVDIRRRMSPVFSSGKMKLMSGLMFNSAEGLIDYMQKKIGRKEPMEVKDLFVRFTIDSITSTAFGLNGDCFKDTDSPFRAISRRILNWRLKWQSIQSFCFFMAPKLVLLFHMRFIDELSSNFFREVFWTTMTEREKNKTKRNDLLDIIIEMKKNDELNNEEIIDGDVLVAQAAQFFIAGFETTSSTLTFLMMELARNPEIQRKAREDILSARNKYGGFTYEALQEMEYLESAIYETVRKYPVLPFLDRRCNKRYEIPGTELILEKGDSIYIPVMGIHYDPDYYPDPHRFDPERFYKENKDKRQSITFLGFGAGPRYCIGQRYGLLNAKACLSHLLSRFEVKSEENVDVKFEFNNKGFTLQPERDVFLKFLEIK